MNTKSSHCPHHLVHSKHTHCSGPPKNQVLGFFSMPLWWSISLVVKWPILFVYWLFLCFCYGMVVLGHYKGKCQHAVQLNLGSLASSCWWRGFFQQLLEDQLLSNSAGLVWVFSQLPGVAMWMAFRDSCVDHLPFFILPLPGLHISVFLRLHTTPISLCFPI